MPKKSRRVVKKQEEESDSDDSRAYENDSDPDYDDFFHDEVDDFHDEEEKVLLKNIKEDSDEDEDEEWESDNEQEVLGLDLSDDDDEEITSYKKQLWRLKQNKKKSEMGSDLEDEDVPDIKTFGKKRSHYYGADVGDSEIDVSGSEDEEGAAALEEKEALALQQKIAEELDEQDFGLDIFKPDSTVTENKEEKITKDLSKLSKREKLQILKKESPELMTLIEDFKTKMAEVRDTLLPLLKVVRAGKLQGKAAQYVETKCKLNLNYCTNISFYMMLKAKQQPVHNHPVIKRLVQYRNLMKQLEPVDEQTKEEMLDVVKRLKNGETVDFGGTPEETKTFVRRSGVRNVRQRTEQKKLSDLVSDSEEEEDHKVKKRKLKDGRYETKDEKEALAYYEMMKDRKKTEDDESVIEDVEIKEPDMGDEEEEEEEEEEEGKRAITYQIEKNKGLTPKRKKEQRNPRVKHRMKYRKAKIRRKGQIREPRTETSRYGGEISGIRAGIKRSIKIRV